MTIQEQYICDNCGKEIELDYHVVDSYFNWCCECFHQKYDTCENCGEDYEYKYMREVDKIDYQEHYCEICYKKIMGDK
jgi:hypothetical protein